MHRPMYIDINTNIRTGARTGAPPSTELDDDADVDADADDDADADADLSTGKLPFGPRAAVITVEVWLLGGDATNTYKKGYTDKKMIRSPAMYSQHKPETSRPTL